MIRLTDDIVLNPNLSKTLVDFLRALEYHVNKDGICWPGRERIAAVMRTSVRTVSRCIKEALELKLIAVVRRRRRSNVYQLLCGKVYPQQSLDVPPKRHVEQTSFLKERSGNGVKKKPWKEVTLLWDDISKVMGPDLAKKNMGWFVTLARKCSYEHIQQAIHELRCKLLEAEVGSGEALRSPSGWFTYRLRQLGAAI